MNRNSLGWLAAAVLMALAGCNTFTPKQSMTFTDEDGNLVKVVYGSGSKKHKTTFVSPKTGKPIELSSFLQIEFTLPDGDTFHAYECMNMLPSGTMYQTDDEQLKFHANGVTCAVYDRFFDQAKGEYDYLEIYRGVICQQPKNMEK